MNPLETFADDRNKLKKTNKGRNKKLDVKGLKTCLFTLVINIYSLKGSSIIWQITYVYDSDKDNKSVK